MEEIALITGITGQDGAYLSQLLLNKGYVVIGVSRSYNRENFKNLDYLGILDKIVIEECDLLDLSAVIKLLGKFRPHEIYNLAAQSSVGLSFLQPIGTIQFNVTSVLNLLESIKHIQLTTRFYQASSSEMYGRVQKLPVSIDAPMHPLSPYAISKATAHWAVINYRESYGLFACSGVLFNHESYLRSPNFFVKKIISESLKNREDVNWRLKVGNIDIKRDFGYSPSYVEAMWLMLQAEKPEDFIICSGKSITLRSIIEHVFLRLEISLDKLVIDNNLFRPTDIDNIHGDNTPAKNILRWDYDFDFYEILDIIIDEEIRNIKIKE